MVWAKYMQHIFMIGEKWYLTGLGLNKSVKLDHLSFVLKDAELKGQNVSEKKVVRNKETR